MVNEIPFKKKKENASVLAWCNDIKLWPGKFLYYFIVYFSFSLLQSKQFSLRSLFQGLRFPFSFHDSVSVIPCYRAVLKKTFKVRFNSIFSYSFRSYLFNACTHYLLNLGNWDIYKFKTLGYIVSHKARGILYGDCSAFKPLYKCFNSFRKHQSFTI